MYIYLALEQATQVIEVIAVTDRYVTDARDGIARGVQIAYRPTGVETRVSLLQPFTSLGVIRPPQPEFTNNIK
ncbi:hypothetical protein [Rhizobium mongolense]|uniref:Uncharacterized protein n=1 Tax=Rhizobium mongolense TaxID=57676 RepID=A0A7W6RTV3_9HYPH|nr:hypothetical protein [Rhizobium mongolense]MBB4277981.1 hypothetical protein [Rhizobium mongolense]